MRELKERLILKYSEQVEFIRFRDIALEADIGIRRLDITRELLQMQKAEALAEIERMFESEVI